MKKIDRVKLMTDLNQYKNMGFDNCDNTSRYLDEMLSKYDGTLHDANARLAFKVGAALAIIQYLTQMLNEINKIAHEKGE